MVLELDGAVWRIKPGRSILARHWGFPSLHFRSKFAGIGAGQEAMGLERRPVVAPGHFLKG
ncbi:MAG: hypothetical protein M3R41_05415 [Pseudomonadota bacterium]|nr:hypothetical protein [Pseudomonadota bacterium]